MKNIKTIVLILLVVMFGFSISANANTNGSGEKVYKTVCLSCHANGDEGAPRTGVAKEWKSHFKSGKKHMIKHVKKGTGHMPPMGGCTDCTDAEIEAAVQYIIDNTK
jgi:cytochrome c5